MPDNEESTPDATTELPVAEPVAVTAAQAAPPPPVAVVVPAPTTHSTTRVILAAVAGAVVVFLIAGAGILGYAIGSHHNSSDGAGRMAQLSRGHDGGMGQQFQRGPGFGWGQGQRESAPDSSQGQGTLPAQPNPQGQGTMPGFPGQQQQAPGGMLGQLPSQ